MSGRLGRISAWYKPLLLTAIPVALLVGYLAVTRPAAWLVMTEIIVVAFACYVAAALVKLRSFIEFTPDNALRTRQVFRTHRVTGPEVREVRGVFNGASPNVRLLLDGGRSVVVPSSQFERGHSALFTWLRDFAPQATHDKEAARIGGELVRQGIL